MQQGLPSRAGKHDRKAFMISGTRAHLVKGRGNCLEDRFLAFRSFNSWRT
jgi:hypothetical protein